MNQQIDILHQRGLKINSHKNAKQFLLRNNYYNIINGYSKYFQQSTNKYIQNANFDEISNLYFYDRQIKHYTLRAILEAENNLKYTTAYYFAKNYPDKQDAYLLKEYYDQSKQRQANKTIAVFNKRIDYLLHSTKSDNPIKHYVRTYKDVPIWVIIEYLMFGELTFFIGDLPDTIQDQIAKSMYSFISNNNTKITQTFTKEILISFLKNIKELRNTCAHDNKLIGFRTQSDIKYYDDLHKRYNISKNSERRNFYNLFIILQCFISDDQYGIMHDSIVNALNELEREITSVDFNILLKEYGFPKDWHRMNVRFK